jgi:hypothetical protein
MIRVERNTLRETVGTAGNVIDDPMHPRWRAARTVVLRDHGELARPKVGDHST